MRNLDHYLGDGGMPILTTLGASFVSYGAGWSQVEWAPTSECCNPAGRVQAGIFGVVLDAAMYFALVASLERGEHGATLDMNTQVIRSARMGDTLTVRGQVMRVGNAIAFCEAEARENNELVASARGTFTVKRQVSPA